MAIRQRKPGSALLRTLAILVGAGVGLWALFWFVLFIWATFFPPLHWRVM